MEDKSKLNVKDLATAIATKTLKYIHDHTHTSLASAYLTWAREYGANIPEKDQEQALTRLKNLIPEPAAWPSIEVVGAGVKTSHAAPPKVSREGTTTKKATEFSKLEVPAGIEPPTCPSLKKSGADKGKACGKLCKYVLDEHNNSNPECRTLTCNHAFCGTHITKASTEESAAYDQLNAAAAPEKRPISVGTSQGQEQVGSKILGALNEDTGKKASDAVMQRLLDKVKAQTEAVSAATAAANGGNSNNSK